MLKRFIVAFAIFLGLILPGALLLALMAASAYPAPAPRAQSAAAERPALASPYVRPSSMAKTAASVLR